MNAPYFSLVKECFPHAEVIVDRFHIIQHLNKYFDTIRKRIMKNLDQSNREEAKQYRQLKSLYKLLLKPEEKLNYTRAVKRQNFQWRLLTETEVVHRLLAISTELNTAYYYFQALLSAFHDRDHEGFFQLLREMPQSVPPELHHVKKAFFTYETEIRLALIAPHSNAKLENLHRYIKALKRISYGFRSFSNMKNRIFLINDLITYT